MLTETHLRQREVDRLEIQNYFIENKRCRDEIGSIDAGVRILAHHSLNAEPVALVGEMEVLAEACSAKIYPTTYREAALSGLG